MSNTKQGSSAVASKEAQDKKSSKKFLNESQMKEVGKEESSKDFTALLAAVAFAYFSFGAITNVAGAIIPKIRETYSVSSSLSSFLAATFFIAYGLTSVPWGMFMDKAGKKKTLLLSSAITTLGVLLFAAIQSFGMNMFSMFLCGVGITGVQVALNPLVAEISDPAKYSRNLTAFMVINGAGSSLAPFLVTFLKDQGLHWSTTYWVFTAIAVVMLAAIAIPKFPSEQATETKEVEQVEDETNYTFDLLTSKPLIYLYAAGIFLYVGVEVGVANTIGFYFEDKFNISALAGADAEAIKNSTIGLYWMGLLAGRLVGTAVLNKVSGKVAIRTYIALAAGMLYLAMTGDFKQAQWAFPAIGFFISIMFPTIYSLATNSFPKEYNNAISGILCTAIIGGAAIGPVIAKVAEVFQGSAAVPNWDAGLVVAFACYAYIFILGQTAPEEQK